MSRRVGPARQYSRSLRLEKRLTEVKWTNDKLIKAKVRGTGVGGEGWDKDIHNQAKKLCSVVIGNERARALWLSNLIIADSLYP